MLPQFTREQLLTALRRFDTQLRDTSAWSGWASRPSHRWAIQFEGRRYPVKQVVALAADVAPHTFSGGEALNRLVARLGFTVIRLDCSETRTRDAVAPEFLRARVAELELEVLAVRVRLRLTLGALAAMAELAEHVAGCPASPCCCGYTAAEQHAASAVALVTMDDVSIDELVAALIRASPASAQNDQKSFTEPGGA